MTAPAAACFTAGMAAPGIIPLRVSGKLVSGGLLRVLDAKRGVAGCVSEPTTGSGAGAHRHLQPEPAAAWYINHNLGLQCNARAYSDGGREMLGEVIHASANQCVIYFDSPVSGYAVCS